MTAPPVEQTRARLLHATAVVLSRRGYSQTRLTEIAATARMKSPAIYYHFRSRDDLITAALREGQVLVREHVTAALDALPPGTPAMAAVLAAVEAHLRVELELSDFGSAVVRTAGHVPPAVRAGIEDEIEAYYEIWRGLLARAEAEGSLRPGLDHSVLRMLVLGALNWATEWRTPATGVDDVVAAACSIVGHALASPADHFEYMLES